MNKLIAILTMIFLSGCIRLSVTPTVTGQIIDKATSMPITNATITVSHYMRPEWVSSATSDKNGMFKVSPAKIWTQVPFDPVIIIKGDLSIKKNGYQSYEISVMNMKNFKYKKADLGVINLEKTGRTSASTLSLATPHSR